MTIPNVALDCFCSTCQRRVTVDEVRERVHSSHEFTPADRTAIDAVYEYLKNALGELVLPKSAAA